MQSKLPQKYKKENDTTIHTIIIKKKIKKLHINFFFLTSFGIIFEFKVLREIHAQN